MVRASLVAVVVVVVVVVVRRRTVATTSAMRRYLKHDQSGAVRTYQLRDRLFRPYTPLHFQTRHRAMLVAINAFEKTLCIFTTMALQRHIGFTLFAGWQCGNDGVKKGAGGEKKDTTATQIPLLVGG